MGKRKQVRPTRNPNATVLDIGENVAVVGTEEGLSAITTSSEVQTNKRRRRRIIIRDDDESSDDSSIEVERGGEEEITNVNATKPSTIEDLLRTVIRELFPEYKEAEAAEGGGERKNVSSRTKVQDPSHLETILDYLLILIDSKFDSKGIVQAIVDYQMLEVYVVQKVEYDHDDFDNTILSRCIFQQTIPLPLQQGDDDPFTFQVYISLTTIAYQRASPICVSNYLLGTNNIRNKRNANLHAASCLRRSLAALFPTTLIDGINLDPSGQKSDPIEARFVYGLVDNIRISDKFRLQQERCSTQPITRIPGLRPELRPYQAYALEWMLTREKNESQDDDNLTWQVCWIVIINEGASIMTLVDYQKEFSSQKKKKNPVILYNPFAGWLCNTMEEARLATVGDTYSSVQGGILADSMGLGKTVEILSCILSNPRPARDVSKISNESIREAEMQDERQRQTVQILDNETTKDEPVEEMQVPLKAIVNVKRDKSPGKNVEGGVARIVCIYKCPSDTSSSFLYDVKYVVGGKKERKITRSMFTTSPRDIPDNNGEPNGYGEDVCAICGKTNMTSLGWVRCSGCKERLHCACAGYTSQEEIPISSMCSTARCPPCCGQMLCSEPIRSRGTLIVTPPSILEQWATEIRRHSSESLKIVVYPGLKKLCDNTKSVDVRERLLVHSHYLADADIVLTTFPVLNGELSHSDNQFLDSGKSFRSKKRYRVIPSPLNSIEWWRICLDEAQRVEGTAAAAAKMALRLKGCNRWCVTGTPIGRGRLDDLYGLLLFVGVMPFQDREWFRHVLHGSHIGIEQRIKSLLYPIFWRSTKANRVIREQIGIPEQIEKKVILEFSSIEKHFYKKQLENTILAVNDINNSAGKRRNTEAISSRLHSLRAACCHPQVGSSGIQRLGKKMSSMGDHVLSMQQILDKLIDDSRLKCEESQRIAIMHSNALACITKLKVELKQRQHTPFQIEESEQRLLSDSAEFYFEALELTDMNAKPAKLIGEAELNGCSSFLNSGKVIRNGGAILQWRLKRDGGSPLPSPVWANTEFALGKKLTAFKVRPVLSSSTNLNMDDILVPNECVLQMSLASIGGEFVDVRRFSFGKEQLTDWLYFEGIRTKKSKIWRICVQNYHKTTNADRSFALVGLEIQLMEPSVGSDDLQRMHILHNSSLVVDSLIQSSVRGLQSYQAQDTLDNLKKRLKDVNSELRLLESNYLGSAKANHRASQFHLNNISQQQSNLELELIRLSENINLPLWKDMWWQDLLSYLQVDKGTSPQAKNSLCVMVKNDLFELFNGPFHVGESGFPEFGSIFGLHVALKSRKEDLHRERTSISKVVALKEIPSDGELLENSSCRKCRADWFQTGPKCSHCKLEEELIMYQKGFDDKVFWTILHSLLRWLKEMRSNFVISSDETKSFLANVKERATAYFNLHDCEKKELTAAKRHWRMHFELLSDYDELNACKSTMRLPKAEESIHLLPRHEQDRIVDPRNIPALIMDHKIKQAGALGALRRDTASLRYLKNQSIEQSQAHEDHNHVPSCPVCLMEFNVDDRAVLKCGHSLHVKCIDEILRRSGGSTSIRCPMKCLTVTKKSDVLIAAADSLFKADGSKVTKKIEGSWGTKVDRLIADVIDVIRIGERCIVFSQWDDLLTIIESALSANNISFTHPKSAKMFGDSVQSLRSSCHVMLLNVKRGAEGLTLVEATHAFIVEPLLHCGLDAQAINRIHRIGQTRKTYIHRYIIKGTIEEKIDAIRMERQVTFENIEEEDSTVSGMLLNKGNKIQAGGLDGGLTSEELQHVLSNLD